MQEKNIRVSPFDEDTEQIIWQTRQSIGSTIVMAFGWMLLTVALIGGAYLAYRYLTDAEEKRILMIAPLVVLGFTYLAGWVVSLVSIRAFYNLVMPVVVRVYTFGVLGGILMVYFRVIYKIFIFPNFGSENLLPSNNNFVILLFGFLLLTSLDLLSPRYTLLPHVLIMSVAIFIHLLVSVIHYVFFDPVIAGLVTFDIYYLLTVLLITLLMAQKHLYEPFRELFRRMFLKQVYK